MVTCGSPCFFTLHGVWNAWRSRGIQCPGYGDNGREGQEQNTMPCISREHLGVTLRLERVVSLDEAVVLVQCAYASRWSEPVRVQAIRLEYLHHEAKSGTPINGIVVHAYLASRQAFSAEDEALGSLGCPDAVGFQDGILHRFPYGARQQNSMRKCLMLAEIACARDDSRQVFCAINALRGLGALRFLALTLLMTHAAHTKSTSQLSITSNLRAPVFCCMQAASSTH